ncbi:MAG: hypothetical protein WD648_06215 [Planctomycetaceae bacterium]
MDSLWIVVGCLAFAALAYLAWKPIRARLHAREERRAIREFRVQREQLEAKFFDLAAGQGKPRGLTWRDCEWQSGVVYARDIQSRMMTAFVGVNIRFEAIEGGDMEDVAAVQLVRDAAAVFHYRRGRWGTGGKALFNMNPQDALVRLQGQFEPIDLKPHLPPGVRTGSEIR